MSASNKKPVKKLDPASADYKECISCLEELEEKPEAEPFLIPVDWKGLNLPDYPKIVKKPMDLGSIRTKLEAGNYANVLAFGADVRLVWANAMKFNQPGSGIYVAAETLQRVFEKRFSKVSKAKPPSAPTSTTASGTDLGKKRKRDQKASGKTPQYGEKIKFTQLINQMTSAQIGKIVEMVQTRCPSALIDDDESFLEIEVENIDKATLGALISFAETCVGGSGETKKLKK